MSHIDDANEKLWKASVRKQLEAFLASHPEVAAQPDQWKALTLVYKAKTIPNKLMLCLQSTNTCHQHTAASLSLASEEMEEKLFELKALMYAECEKLGFKVPANPRTPPLSSVDVELVRLGDSGAVGKFAEKHASRLIGYADRAMRDKASHTYSLQSPEDLVYGAIFQLALDARKRPLLQHHQPLSILASNIYRDAGKKPLRAWRPESNPSIDFDSIPERLEENNDIDIIAQQAMVLLTETRTRLTESQRKVFDIVIQHTDPPLSLQEIGILAGYKETTAKENAKQMLNKIAAKAVLVVEELGEAYEPLAKHIDKIMCQLNAHGRSRKHNR